MSQASGKKAALAGILRGPTTRGPREALLIFVSALALYLILALSSYQPSDPGWSHTGPAQAVANQGGVVGAWLADVFLYLFGVMAYLFPLMVGYGGWMFFRKSEQFNDPDGDVLLEWSVRASGFVITLGAGCGIATLHYGIGGAMPVDAGGVLGNLVGLNLAEILNSLGATLFLIALFLTGFSLFTGISWLTVMDITGRTSLRIAGWLFLCVRQLCNAYERHKARREREKHVESERERTRSRKPPRIEPVVTLVEPSERVEKERQQPLFDAGPAAEGLPELNLLEAPKAVVRPLSEAALEAMSRQVELKLAEFNIDAEVVEVHPGPVVTRYELQPAPGLKASKVSALSKDLARSLSTVSVRVVEVIPGKSTIGIELPNEEREMVTLGEVVKSAPYDKQNSRLALALGKDIAGAPVVVDLAAMPHLLVAGTTGSGKSVAINAMILSLLYKALPSEVRLILIDPKMLELSVYEGIPHLLAPVVTDMSQASNALRWCVAEMERRYQLMSALGVRNIGGYNRKVKEAAEAGKPLKDPLFKRVEPDEEVPELEALPFLVVVVDELADLMMVTGKKVEELIARLAQKARASGIHLILATQRPSVDVITGLIKANIPSRIAFQVSSKVDSRTIIDQMGAQDLLGHGDMLYMGPGTSTLSRVHGAFVADQEVHRVVADLKRKGQPQYIDEILEGPGNLDMIAGSASASMVMEEPDGEGDPLYDQAVRIVTETRRASISGVQRRLKVGYNRAARMLEQMEESGVVGPLQANGARQVIAPPPPPN